jgi:hypothetical protein
MKTKKQNHTQGRKNDLTEQQLNILLAKKLLEFENYTLNTLLEFKILPDIDRLLELYTKTREIYIGFRNFIEKKIDLSEREKDFYVNTAVDKYNNLCCIFANLSSLKGAKVEMTMDKK